ncbi:nickel ABC transporter permease [Eubacterium sp. An3]|uniref:nickel ABC transporter permease n=1 Tax=Eubacterium sp. An3 TaxID=1965628 RepID=UPI000B369C15|nr:nickel ABC transporter permease [Eubacterium sp. An3]OUO26165.1 nickel ABC transporter permease subunit NikB [Eubacterium sp. An3]
MTAKQLGKRLIQIVFVVLGISFLSFLITYLAPGDPVRTMYAASGIVPSEEVIQQTREAMGLNRPVLVQYADWLWGCLHGDFGTSYAYNNPVSTLLLNRLWPTLKLSIFAMILMLAVSVPVGMIQATHKNTVLDYGLRGITFFGVSMPNFWVGLLLMLFFCVQLKWLPVVCSGGDFKSMILPAVTLAFAMSAKYTRQVRTAILEELSQDYVVGARARGVKEWKILWMNVFPNSLLPLLTMLGLSMGSLLGGTAVVEVIFTYPGMGNLAVSAITAYDYPLIQGYVLWISLIYMVVNLLVDISYNLVDPRMKGER